MQGRLFSDFELAVKHNKGFLSHRLHLCLLCREFSSPEKERDAFCMCCLQDPELRDSAERTAWGWDGGTPPSLQLRYAIEQKKQKSPLKYVLCGHQLGTDQELWFHTALRRAPNPRELGPYMQPMRDATHQRMDLRGTRLDPETRP